jgi:uncharacterized protein (TIGR04222 family)
MVDWEAAGTWGIGGPTFLVLYGLLAIMIGASWWLARQQVLASRGFPVPPGELSRRPQDLAYLNGGPQLAVFSALSAMRLHGWVSVSSGAVRAVGTVGPGATDLERAIHAVTTKPVHRLALPAERPVGTALEAIAQRLVRTGLLVPDEARLRLRRIGFWMAGAAVLGVARLVAGLQGGRPVGFLALELAAVTVATIVILRTVPRRTEHGDRVLAELRSLQYDLDPANRPNWTVYGPAAAALGVGLFGVSALWASDPAMAAELEAQRAAAMGGASGYSGGGGDGGSGDGGGSSCGGGGCGGGCGG